MLATAVDGPTLDAWVARREQGEPLAWITGRFRFCDRWYSIDPGVYVPRPQTEELAHRAAVLLPDGGIALDLCTGAGPIAAHLAAEVPSATVVGADVDPIAVVCARHNGVLAVLADIAAPIRPAPVFDVVTAVAPYVPSDEIAFLPTDVQRYEARTALDGGSTGLDLVDRVVEAASMLLRPGGHLLLELGGSQDTAIAGMLDGYGLGEPEPWYDEDGDLRGVASRRGPI